MKTVFLAPSPGLLAKLTATVKLLVQVDADNWRAGTYADLPATPFVAIPVELAAAETAAAAALMARATALQARVDKYERKAKAQRDRRARAAAPSQVAP